jgi:hypothetical protein
MSGLSLEGIKTSPNCQVEGQTDWWGNADQIQNIRIYNTPELATNIGVLLAGKKAVEIAQRGWNFADPVRDDPDFDPDDFANERLVRDSVRLQPQSVHLFRKDIAHGVSLSPVDENAIPFGLVIPGSGVIIHRAGASRFKKVAAEAMDQEPLDLPINGKIASIAIGLANGYAQLKARQPVLL